VKRLLTGAAAVLGLLVVGVFGNVAASRADDLFIHPNLIEYVNYRVVTSSDWEVYTFPPGADDQVLRYVNDQVRRYVNRQNRATAPMQYFVNYNPNGGITLRLRFLSTPDVWVVWVGDWTTSIQEARRLRDDYRRRGYDAHVQRDSDMSFVR
jgi:hypothetical protein